MPPDRGQRADVLQLALGVWRSTGRSGETVQTIRTREHQIKETCSRSLNGQRHIEGSRPGKLVSPAKKRRAATDIQQQLQMSQRRVCRVLEQPRSTQRQEPVHCDGEAKIREEIVRLACQYGRYGYRRITALLRNDGWKVNHKCVERIWRLEGLKVPPKQPKRKRLWFNDGSCIRKRPEYRNHVWSYDFVADRTSNGKPLRMLTLIDEYTRESLAIKVDRALKT